GVISDAQLQFNTTLSQAEGYRDQARNEADRSQEEADRAQNIVDTFDVVPSWNLATLEPGWSGYGGGFQDLSYRYNPYLEELEIIGVASAVANAERLIFELPEMYRPGRHHRVTAMMGHDVVAVDIISNGEV